MRHRHIGIIVLYKESEPETFVDQIADRRMDGTKAGVPAAKMGGIENGEIMVGIDHHIGSRSTVPPEFAKRTSLTVILIDQGANAKTVAVAWTGSA